MGAAATQLTDYISPQVLEREGYIHVSDKSKMLEKVGREFLVEQGWVCLEQLRHVWLPISKAAEIVGCSRQTLERYINEGYIPAEDGKVTMLDAIRFDYKEAKIERAKSKVKIDNAH